MSKLALFGGEKAVKKSLKEISFDFVPEKGIKKAEELMRAGEISLSPLVYEFEEKFGRYIGRKHALCVTSGTTSIQSALFAVGVGAGDEVIVPSFTFWATVGPVVACNAVPVFADCDVETHNITAEAIEKCITPRTKAIIAVHVWGTPCDLDPIVALAKKHNLKLIEDCSHAHGATYNGKKVGTFGDVGCFSMQGSKLLMAGEGGILVTDNREYYERSLALGHYERLSSLPEDSEYRKYSLTGFGFKHRIHPVAAAIADANLQTLDEYNEIRTKNAKYFEELMSDLDFITFQKVPEKAERVYGYHYGTYHKEKFGGLSLYTLLKALTEEGVTCGPCGYGMLHKAPLYTEKKNSPMHAFSCPCYDKEYDLPETLPNSEFLREAGIYLAPRFESATKEDIEQYSIAYHKVAENLAALLAYEEENNLGEKKVDSAGRSITTFKD
ncbi:MAG: DegT/DnrJ/EryC1/StrS family aminotransferase [Oscillospiraceae bacterium]|nr:DegT/DnrJ/EryC1/StrS family aminotransferase [Oscillospiraceae bacterium]